MTNFIVGFGSNIEPFRNLFRVIETFTNRFEEFRISTIHETVPRDIETENAFLNTVFSIPSETSRSELKQLFVGIECCLGRNRLDPERKKRDRPVDLDILAESLEEVSEPEAFEALEAYYRAPVWHLIEEDGYELPDDLEPELESTIKEIYLKEQSLGKTPATINRDVGTGEVVVR